MGGTEGKARRGTMKIMDKENKGNRKEGKGKGNEGKKKGDGKTK